MASKDKKLFWLKFIVITMGIVLLVGMVVVGSYSVMGIHKYLSEAETSQESQ